MAEPDQPVAPTRIFLRCPKCGRSVTIYEKDRRRIVRCPDAQCREPLEVKGVTVGYLSREEAQAIDDSTRDALKPDAADRQRSQSAA